MDRNTILAIILSVLVITIGMTIQATFFAPSVQEEVVEEAINVEEIYLQPETYSKLPSNLAWTGFAGWPPWR